MAVPREYIERQWDKYPFPVHQACREIAEQYGDYVLVKPKTLRKWGARTVVGTGIESLITAVGSETQETMLATNGITSVSSSSASDTQTITLLEGHTVADGNLTFSAYAGGITLTGRTTVTLPVALRNATRARLASPAQGTIYFHEGGATTNGVPDDLTKVHLVVPQGEMQTQRGQTAVSSVDYWIVTGGSGSVLSKTSAWAQFRLERKLFTDTYFYPITQWIGVSDASGTRPLVGDSADSPYAIVPANHDVRLAVQANTAGIQTAGGVEGFLAIIQDVI